VFQLVGEVKQVVAAKAVKLDERTSVRMVDKDGAERCWMSLFLHGQRSALAQGSIMCSVKKMYCINELKI
jgi:hypothetical protein